MESENKRILHRRIRYHHPTATSECCDHAQKCTSIKHAIHRFHLQCVETLLQAGCEWWNLAIQYVVQHASPDRLDEILTYCIDHDAPRKESEVVSSMIHLNPKGATARVDQLLASGKCWYEFNPDTPTQLVKQKTEYNINLIHLTDVLYFKQYDITKWMFFTKGARMSLQEAEMAARNGYFDLMDYYFSQPLRVIDDKPRPRQVSWLLFRNAYRGGSLECLKLAIEQKCPCPEWILEVDTSIDCFRHLLYRFTTRPELIEKEMMSSLVAKILSDPNLEFLEIAMTEYEELVKKGLQEVEDEYCHMISMSHVRITTLTLRICLGKMSVAERLLHASLYYKFNKQVAQSLIDEHRANIDPYLLFFDQMVCWEATDWYLSVKSHPIEPIHIGRWKGSDFYTTLQMLNWFLFVYYLLVEQRETVIQSEEWILIDQIAEEHNWYTIQDLLRDDWGLGTSRKKRDKLRDTILSIWQKIHKVTQFLLCDYFVGTRKARYEESDRAGFYYFKRYLTYLNNFLEEIRESRDEVKRVLRDEVRLYNDLCFEVMSYVV